MMKALASAIAVAVLTLGVFLPSRDARADADDNLGGPGESCRARPDCKKGLKCIANVCIDDHDGQTCAATAECGTLKCIDNKCVNPLKVQTTPHVQPQQVQPQQIQPQQVQPQQVQPQPIQQNNEVPPSNVQTIESPPAPPASDNMDAAIEKWLLFDRRGIHPFIGLTLALGLMNGGYTASEGTSWGPGADSALLFAIRGGVVFDRHEIALEIAPGTYFWDLSVGGGPAFEMNVSYAYRIPLLVTPKGGIHYPLRAGLGFVAGGNNLQPATGNALFEIRADLIGLALDMGHLTIEVHAPSFRYQVTNGHVDGIAVEGVTTQLLSFLFGTSVTYTF